jgi:tetratricopeptide (TPR) repeat protein
MCHSKAVYPLSVLLMLLVALALPRASAAAAADDDAAVANAREHAQKGKAFMDLAKYQDAATEYEAAYAAKPDPALLLNLAQAYRLAGNADKALFFYRKYLQHVPKSPYRADIEEKIAALEKQSKGTGGGVTPPPADTQVQPHQPSTTGWPSSGASSGASSPPGGYPPAGSSASGPSTGVPPIGPDGNPGGAGYVMPPPSGPPGPGGMPPGADADHGRKLKLAGLVTGGAGVLSIVVGAIFGAQAKDAAQKIEKAAANGDVYGPELQTQDSRGRSAQNKETVFLVIGTAALATGGVLYYLGGRQSSEASAEARSVAIVPAASANQLGALVKVTF